jgi:exodeoxyribonuclease V alpha subunit
MRESLNGFIERVTYHNAENGFAVLRVKIKGRNDGGPGVGKTTLVRSSLEIFSAKGA